jgi:PcRGLX-like protein central beta sandwich domain/PcRGLX-like N-terminal RIFT barrel domain
MILVICVLAILGLAVRAETAPIDVRLTVEETAGVDRLQWPVTAGIPLPKGVLKSTERLQILDAQGRFVPARFAVASRWWEDGSIQWVHCDFAATVKANNQAILFLRDVVPLPEFPSPIGFIPRGKEFEVITGPLRLVLGGNSNQLLDQVWVDEGWGYNFDERTKILDSGNFDLVLTSAGRNYRTSHWTQNLVEVEEYNALRAVVKISGSFALADSKDKRLDYLARLTVYGGKTYFKLDFTLLNRDPGTALAEVPVDDLAFSFKMNLDLTQ